MQQKPVVAVCWLCTVFNVRSVVYRGYMCTCNLGGISALVTFVSTLLRQQYHLTSCALSLLLSFLLLSIFCIYYQKDLPNARPLQFSQGRVEFRNVFFSYNADRPILKNVSFEVQKRLIIGRCNDSFISFRFAKKVSLVTSLP